METLLIRDTQTDPSDYRLRFGGIYLAQPHKKHGVPLCTFDQYDEEEYIHLIEHTEGGNNRHKSVDVDEFENYFAVFAPFNRWFQYHTIPIFQQFEPEHSYRYGCGPSCLSYYMLERKKITIPQKILNLRNSALVGKAFITQMQQEYPFADNWKILNDTLLVYKFNDTLYEVWDKLTRIAHGKDLDKLEFINNDAERYFQDCLTDS